MKYRQLQRFFSMSMYLFSRTTKSSSFEMVAHLRMNVKSHMWDVRLFHFSFSSLLSIIPPNPIFFLLFFSLFLPICSQGQTFSGPFFLYIEPHKEVHTCVLANFLVFLVVRLARPKDLWTGGWGKLWNLLFALDWQNVSIFTSVHVVYRVAERGTMVPKAAQLIAVSLRDPPLTVSRSPFCNLLSCTYAG